MQNLQNLFKAASVAFSLLPGVAILITDLGVPPNSSKILFAGTIEAVGVLTLLCLWTNKHKIIQVSAEKITRYAVVFGAAFIVSLFVYTSLFNIFVVQHENYNPLLFPIWPQGELKAELMMHESKTQLIDAWGRDDVYKVIISSSPVSLQLTTLLFLLNYIILFLSVTVAFGLLGLKNMNSEIEVHAI